MEFLTHRLRLREIEEQDYDFFYELELNKTSLKYQQEVKPTIDRINKKYNLSIQSVSENPRYRYCMIMLEKDSNIPIGRVVLWRTEVISNRWELAWFVHPEYWGRGYAPEAAKALIEFGFEKLGIDKIEAGCNRGNHNSEQVMKKIGMKRERILKNARYFNGAWYIRRMYSLREVNYELMYKQGDCVKRSRMLKLFYKQ